MTRRAPLIGFVGLGVATVVFFYVRLAPGGGRALLDSDLLIYFYPLYDITYRRLAALELPTWNPYQLCGSPWIATLQGGFFYPGHVLYLAFDTHTALHLSTALHVVLIAVGIAIFARRAGLGWTAALLAAVLFAWRGATPLLTFSPNSLEAAAWLPVGGIVVLRLARGDRARAGALLALCTTASLLAGYPQTTVFVAYTWATLLAALLLGTRASARRWLTACAVFGLALAVGALAAGAQLLPAAELTARGTRQTHRLTLGEMYPLGGPAYADVSLRFLREQAVAGGRLFFGVIGLSLLPGALLARRHRALAWWALAIGMLSLLFAAGPATPLFNLYLALPVINWYRVPGRILLVTDFCFALLAAVGVDELGHRPGSVPPSAERGVHPRAVALLALGCALGLGLWQAWLGAAVPSLLALGFALAVVAGAWGGLRAGVVLVVCLAAIEMWTIPQPRLLRPYDASTAERYGGFEHAYRELAARVGHDRAWLFAPGWHPDLVPRLATRYRLRSLDDYEPLNTQRQASYFNYFLAGSTRTTRHFDGSLLSLSAPAGRAQPASRRRLLDLAAVRFFVTPRDLAVRSEVRRFTAEAGLVSRLSPDPRLALFENPQALPRAFVVYRAWPVPPTPELLRELSTESFDPLVASFVETDPGFRPGPGSPQRGEAAAFVRDDEDVVEVEATLAAPGLLVLADSFYPGWHATADGIEVPILATNHLFRSVPLPPGHHRVRFEYRPWTVPAGGAATVIGLLLIVALWRRGRAAPAPAPSQRIV